MKTANNIKKTSGFSLVELAVVVVIMGMILTMGIKMASSFQDRSAMSLTRSKQLAIKEALTSYLAVNGRLPCPASATASPISGDEDSTATFTCNTSTGIVPFKTLQLPRDYVVDGWDRFFTYESWWGDSPATYCGAVANNANFTNVSLYNGTRTFHDGDGGCITIKESQINNSAPIVTRYTAATIVSHGANGFGGYSSKGVQVDFSAVGATDPEKDNIIGHGSKTLHTFHTEPFNDKFDDIVLEISPNDLVAPLKREGSITSINQLARDQLIANKSSLVINCQLNATLPANFTAYKLDGSAIASGSYSGLIITNTSVQPVYSASTAIGANEYLNASSVICPSITVP
jgi:prepilin-type N-terminal cleavage/methylation domain-containing protein